MQSSGKFNILGYTRETTSYNKEKGASKDPMEKVTNMITDLVTSQNQLMTDRSTQLNPMRNRIITME